MDISVLFHQPETVITEPAEPELEIGIIVDVSAGAEATTAETFTGSTTYVVTLCVVHTYHFGAVAAVAVLLSSRVTVVPDMLLIHHQASQLVFLPITEVRVKSLQVITSSIIMVTVQGSELAYSAID